MYLFDTNVVSELRKGQNANQEVLAFMAKLQAVAATVLGYDLTVITFNLTDFQGTEAKLHNPFS